MFSFFEYTKEKEKEKRERGGGPYSYQRDFAPVGPIMFKSHLGAW